MKKPRANETDALIGQLIKRARLEQRLSQGYLGHMAGVSFQQIQKYEEGRNRVSASRLLAIARALNISVLELYP